MRSERKFDFVRSSRRFMIISAIITVLGLLSTGIFGLKYGIDFSSGTSMDATTTKAIEQEQVKQFLDSEELGDYLLTVSDKRATIRFSAALTEAQEKQFKADFAAKFDEAATYEVNIVDADIAKEQQSKAIIAFLVASLGIILYMTIRFEWRFAISGVLALFYDAIIVVGLFSIFRWEVNLPFILAVLTIIGYSINDKVVIFDRIRENMRFAKLKTHDDLERLVNDSIWQTLARSVNTVITVLIAAVCLFIFGSESIRMFSLAMIIGLISGAYSSIFIAAQLWLMFKKRSKPKAKAAPKAPATP